MSTDEASRIDEVGDIYDAMADMIEVQGGSIHVGYWESDDDRTPLLEAINRLTDIVCGMLDLQPGQQVLDIGCGVGEPAITLAQRTDVNITGVTNSRWQVYEGTRRANAAGLRGQVRIEFGDAAALSYPDNSFDAALAFESLPHAQDRGQWLREMARVVRPSGRVVLTEFTCDDALSSDEAAILRGVGLQPPTTEHEVVEDVRRSGLLVDEVRPCSQQIRRSYSAYFDRLARMRPSLVAAIGQERVEAQEQAMRLLLPIYRDKIGYAIVVGHLPS
ncbi:class I SAM-dependent methyltransferase [Nocardia panacis]|uniref:Class I SAM-dependent methyltransferase n=1 Tax=Nocardia panacis TaxID=2340916 RepID=A0A3A4K9G2_9NOCA|nr:methyltransferase domain-containing protein [Nocardia panacis]RJO70014.1 class I SAM-dependent methyltransferase [Nocardia panacis]